MQRQSYIHIAEDYFQKKILPGEVVHHIDGNHDNNDPENLVIMKRSQHSRIHGSLYSALETWATAKRTQLCGTCLYVRLYEEYKGEDLDNLWLFADKFLDFGKWKRQPEILDILYEQSKSWMQGNNHNCHMMRDIARLGEERNA